MLESGNEFIWMLLAEGLLAFGGHVLWLRVAPRVAINTITPPILERARVARRTELALAFGICLVANLLLWEDWPSEGAEPSSAIGFWVGIACMAGVIVLRSASALWRIQAFLHRHGQEDAPDEPVRTGQNRNAK